MINKILNFIKNNPGLRQSQISKALNLPLRHVEDVIWELWSTGQIQIEPDSTLRLTRPGEKIFRYL